MIVEFSVKNFRSIKEMQTLSFVATGLKSAEKNAEVDANNIFEDSGIRFLKTIGIYGPNASGKSNLIRALVHFIRAVGSEASSESNLASMWDPFLYQENAAETESFFQIVLIINKRKYRYGFTVERNPEYPGKGGREIVKAEWLYGTKERNTGEYFTRLGNEVDKDNLPNHERIPNLPYSHTFFLTHAAAFDSAGPCAIVRNFLRNWTTSNFVGGFESFRWNSIYIVESEDRKGDLLGLLAAFDLRYDDVEFEIEGQITRHMPVPQEKIYLIKTFREGDQERSVRLNLRGHESAGTQKLFDIAGFLLRAFNMAVSGLVILDELDSNFHPSLLVKLVGLFNNPAVNRNNVQLLFTSHDTNLMNPELMRRDQFFFTEKGEDNATRVYSLAELKGIRNDADFARNYLAGFYGAVPILDSYTIKSPALSHGPMEY
jgi:AAA15 family ATPase/GTPase